jgi:four helix bundle protein
MGANKFQDLVCWQLARDLRKTIAALIRNPPLSYDADLCGQLRRAARSATGNIAEGFPCPSHAEFARFLDISHRSLKEIEDRLIEIEDGSLLPHDDIEKAQDLVKRASVAVSRLIAYLRGGKPRV